MGYQRPELIIETNIAELFVGLTPFAFRMWCQAPWDFAEGSGRSWDPAVAWRTGQKTANTLWLCQNSYWKWPFIDIYSGFIVDLSIENGDFPVCYLSLPEGKPAIPGKSNGETDHFYLPDADCFWFCDIRTSLQIVDEEVRCNENLLVSVCESTLFYIICFCAFS